MFALALVVLLAGMAGPQLMARIDDGRTRGAARFLAGRLALARAQAVARGTAVGIRFNGAGAAVALAAYVDGDEDGIRTGDIAAGVDALLDPPVRLADLFPGVTPSLTLGGGDIVSFTPSGTASSGSIYLRGRDGSEYAVRVLGATARTRVLRFDPVRQAFVDLY